MSVHAITLVEAIDLPPMAKWLLTSLADESGDYRGVEVVSTLDPDHLARRTGLRIEEVEAWLLWFKATGYLRELFREDTWVISPLPNPHPIPGYVAEPPPRVYVPEEDRRAPTPALRAQVLERDEYRCVMCGAVEGLACDHIYPFSLGGKTILENLQILCCSCNSRKGARV